MSHHLRRDLTTCQLIDADRRHVQGQPVQTTCRLAVEVNRLPLHLREVLHVKAHLDLIARCNRVGEASVVLVPVDVQPVARSVLLELLLEHNQLAWHEREDERGARAGVEVGEQAARARFVGSRWCATDLEVTVLLL